MNITADPWDELFEETPRSLKQVAFKEDPIALSVAVYNQYQANPGFARWADLGTAVVTEHDKETAKRIRTMYRDRIMIRSLKGKALTKYQITVYGILNHVPITEEHLGIIYRLPYFYVEDLAKEEIKQHFSKLKHEIVPVAPTIQETRLVPYTQVLRSRKSGDINEFWFSNQNNDPVLWQVAANNPLIGLAKSLVNFNQPMLVKGFVHSKYDQFNQFHYLALTNMEILN